MAGWCIAQLFFNAMLAALVALLPDQVPSAQRGVVSGVLGVCLPVAAVSGTYLVKVFTGSLVAMFMAPCVVAGVVLLLFVARLDDPHSSARSEREPWSLADFARTFYVSPARHADFAWAFVSRFLFVTAYAFLTTYQAFFLLDRVGTSRRRRAAAGVPGDPRAVGVGHRLVAGRRQAVRPDRTPQAVRPGGGGRVRHGDVRPGRGQQLSTGSWSRW